MCSDPGLGLEELEKVCRILDMAFTSKMGQDQRWHATLEVNATAVEPTDDVSACFF